MKRASTGNEPKRPSRASGGELSSSQRLAAAGSQAIEAHTRVRWLADRLGEELDDAEPQEEPSQDLDPADPVVAAVEKAATTMKSVTASMAAVSATSSPLPSTKIGVGAPSGKPPVVKTKLGIGTGPGHKKPGSDE